MKMTIEEALEHGKEQLEIFGGEHKEFIECAIDTMQKYQKIKEIYDNWNVDFGVETHRAMNKIGEVINGRNDD